MSGIVAAAHPLAASAGATILARGGNAFDAAVAVAATLNVVEPYMSSLAGMGLATCWLAGEERVRTLNFVPRIPASFPVERFRSREDVHRGALSVGVPGNLAGWMELVRAHGTMALGDVLEPAIRHARDGYQVTEFNIEETNGAASDIRGHGELWPAWVQGYTAGDGRLQRGAVLRQPDLARTLGEIAAHGPSAFCAKAVAHVGALGGCLSAADIEAIRPTWSDPATARFRDLTVNVPPPPCEGFQMLIALAVLDRIELRGLPRQGVDHLDRVWRAIRLSAGERIREQNPGPDRLAALLHPEHIARLAARVLDLTTIDGPTEQWTAAPGAPPRDQHTTSFSVADAHGNLVCLTQSLGSPFGSAVIVPGTGVLLNNFMYWADVQPSSPNRSVPGGILPMCMSPSISLRDNRPVLALGTPGSYGIMQTQTQVMVQLADYGLAIQDAIEAPRARLWDGRRVEAESRFDPSVLAELRKRGHDVFDGGPWTMKVGGMHGITIDPATGARTGGCDPRRDGYVVAV